MANIVINTTPEEQEAVLDALRKLQGVVVPLSRVVGITGLTYSKVRYVVMDLEDAGKIKRIKAKEFNKHYVRYMYEVL